MSTKETEQKIKEIEGLTTQHTPRIQTTVTYHHPSTSTNYMNGNEADTANITREDCYQSLGCNWMGSLHSGTYNQRLRTGNPKILL